jgi:hypothetical protein
LYEVTKLPLPEVEEEGSIVPVREEAVVVLKMPAEEVVVQLDSKEQGVEVEELARAASSTSTGEVAVSPNQAKEEVHVEVEHPEQL